MGIRAPIGAPAEWAERWFTARTSADQSGLGATSVPAWASIVALVAGIAYVSFLMHWPVAFLPNAGLDDAWFYHQARYLMSGRWQGPFSETTLAKGPGYSFFLALNYLLGLPATLTQAILYAVACGLFARAVFRLSGSAILGLGLFLLMLWHPAIVPTRMIRDDIYAAQTLLLLACLIHALVLPASARARALWAAGAGLALAWLWITREEGVWVLPAVGLLCVLRLWRKPRRTREVLILAGAVVVPLALLSLSNFAAYRTFSIVDFKSRSYTTALAAMQSVRVGEPIPYVPVPGKVRDQIYAVSPAFASLRPFFEGFGRDWTKPGCEIYPTTCGDYAGGWFIWALRDGVARAGHYHSPQAAARFYDQITTEVTTACRSGRLRCVYNPIPYMPAMTQAQWRQAPGKLLNALDLLALRAPPSGFIASVGPAEELQDMWSFEGSPRRTPTSGEQQRSLAGWFYAKDNSWIQLRCADAAHAWILPIPRLKSADLAGYFGDPTAIDRRFNIEPPLGAECGVQRTGAALSEPSVSQEQLLAKRGMKVAGGEVYIDSFGTGPIEAAIAATAMGRLRAAYKAALPVLAAVAALAYLVHLGQLALKRSRISSLWALCHVLWLLVLIRVVVLLLVDLSAFPSITVLYLSAAFPLSCGALALTIFLPFQSRVAVRDGVQRARAPIHPDLLDGLTGRREPVLERPSPTAAP